MPPRRDRFPDLAAKLRARRRADVGHSADLAVRFFEGQLDYGPQMSALRCGAHQVDAREARFTLAFIYVTTSSQTFTSRSAVDPTLRHVPAPAARDVVRDVTAGFFMIYSCGDRHLHPAAAPLTGAPALPMIVGRSAHRARGCNRDRRVRAGDKQAIRVLRQVNGAANTDPSRSRRDGRGILTRWHRLVLDRANKNDASARVRFEMLAASIAPRSSWPRRRASRCSTGPARAIPSQSRSRSTEDVDLPRHTKRATPAPASPCRTTC